MSVHAVVCTFPVLESPVASQLVCGLVNAGQLGQASDFPGPGSEVTEVGLCCLTGR